MLEGRPIRYHLGDLNPAVILDKNVDNPLLVNTTQHCIKSTVDIVNVNTASCMYIESTVDTVNLEVDPILH